MRKDKQYRLVSFLFLFVAIFHATTHASATKTLKFGLHQNKPLNFRDNDGQVKGLVIDVFTHIASQEDWQIEYVPCLWKDCLDKLESGDIDVLSAIGYTSERNEIYDFNETPLITNWGMLVTRPNADIQSILDLEDKTIAVMRRAGHTLALQEILVNFRINAEYLEVDDFIQVFESVRDGKADAGVVNRLLASQFASTYKVMKSSIIFNPIEIRYAFTKNRHPQVLKVTDQHLLSMRNSSESLYYESLSHWFGETSSTRLPDWLKLLLMTCVGVIFLFIAISFFLRQQIKLKTADLHNKNKALEAESKERKIAETRLRESEERYSLAQKAANVGTWDWDIATGTLKWSDQIAPILGFAPGEFGATYKAFLKCIHPEDRHFVINSVNKAHYEGKEYDIEHRIIRPDNTIRWLSVKGNVYRDEEGKPLRMIGVVLDVTEQKESFERFRTILDSFDGLIYVADMESYELLFVNKYGLDVWGDISGKICWQTLQSGQTGPCAFCTNDKLIDAESNLTEPYVWEFRNTVNNEWYECRDQAIQWLDGRIVRMEIASNITQRKVSEKQKEKLEEDLKHAQKMESIGTLAGGIAHDFNNILSAIIGYTELAIDTLRGEDRVLEDLQEVLKAGTRAKELVQQILTFSRKAEQELKPIRIQLIAKEVIKLLRSSIPSTIEIVEDIDQNCENVLADPAIIHQVIMNLCTNAYHAMKEDGGILSISLQRSRLNNVDRVGILSPGEENYLKLEINDTGHGIPEEVHDKIFEPYFTTKGKGEGTGLGLSVVHGIVKSLGGDIKVFSTPGKGCSFQVFLPVVKSREEVVQRKKVSLLPTGNESILIVDDDRTITQLMERILKKQEYQITALTDSEEALKVFQENPDDFDLVITDMTMPKMTGAALSKEILAIRPHAKIIICTGFSDLIDAEKAKSLGVQGFVMKPMDRNDFVLTVRKTLDA